MKTILFNFHSAARTRLGLAVALLALLFTLAVARAERGAARPEPARAAPARATVVDRSSHGSVRHVDTQVVQRPVAVRSEPARVEPARPEPARPVEVRRDVSPRHAVVVHRDVEADVHRRRFWDDFSFGRRLGVLPGGYISLQLGGVPYYYCEGIYYQPFNGGYQEVYPPVGAVISDPPDGSIEVEAGGVTYYYAGGAFYTQQADGTYAIAPTPLGVVVPELPPGAVQVSVNGSVAYQFNGIYYEPVFVNGVTQYQTFTP